MGLSKPALPGVARAVAREAPPVDAWRIGEAVSGFMASLGPVPCRYDAVATVLREVLPENLRAHCRVAGFSNGCLKLVADGSSYVYELQLCKAALLRELERLCPAARVGRIDVGMARL